jgi:hypothetical protein
MRRTFALWFVTSSLACGCAAGLAAPAAFAAGSTGTTTQPAFNLNNAAQNALTPVTTVASSGTTTVSNGGVSSADGFIIAGVAIIVLLGVAFLIRSDAHKHLSHIRHGDREDAMFATAHSGSKTPRKSRKLTPAERKRRKRGKAR